jgi:hypothetical protein
MLDKVEIVRAHTGGSQWRVEAALSRRGELQDILRKAQDE